MEGWIKLHRRLLEWEWYNKSEMVHLFLHILLKANHNERLWRGIKIKRGQLITGLNKLSNETNISTQTIRTCLKQLQKTGEINRQSNNQYSIITINEYDSYQITKEEHNKEANKQVTKRQQTGNKQVTPTKKDKKEKKDNNVKNKYGEFVFLSDVEYLKLKKTHGDFWTRKMIEKLDNHKGANGKTYKSDYRAILSWVVDSIKSSPDYARYMTKRRKEESQVKQNRTDSLNIPGSEQIGIKVGKTPTTNESPPKIN